MLYFILNKKYMLTEINEITDTENQKVRSKKIFIKKMNKIEILTYNKFV